MKAFKSVCMFPNIKCLVTTYLVSYLSESPERSFSSLKRIKTYLRSTMGHELLNGFTMLQINKNIKVKPDELLNVLQKYQRNPQVDLQSMRIYKYIYLNDYNDLSKNYNTVVSM